MAIIGEFCCCRTFVLTFGDVEMTDDGDDAELLVPPPPPPPPPGFPSMLSCMKVDIVLFRQMFRSFDDGSLFSLLLSADVESMNGFAPLVALVGV